MAKLLARLRAWWNAPRRCDVAGCRRPAVKYDAALDFRTCGQRHGDTPRCLP